LIKQYAVRQVSFSGNFVLSTKSKQIKLVQFVSTLSKERNFTTKLVLRRCETATT